MNPSTSFQSFAKFDAECGTSTIACWEELQVLCRLLFFFYYSFKNIHRNTIGVSSSLDPDQVRQYIGPDLGPNCLQKTSADDSSRLRATGKDHLPRSQTKHDQFPATNSQT